MLGALLAIVCADLSMLSKAETERIWLPFTIWLTAAAALLPPRSHRWWLALNVVGALALNQLDPDELVTLPRGSRRRAARGRAGLMKLLDLPGGGSGLFFLVILAGAAFGPRFGMILGITSFVVSAVLSGGIGPWLPFQMLALGWMGAGAGFLGHVAPSGCRRGARSGCSRPTAGCGASCSARS